MTRKKHKKREEIGKKLSEILLVMLFVTLPVSYCI